MKRRILLGLLILIVVLGLCALYVVPAVIGDLRAVRSTLLGSSVDDIERGEVDEAQRRLRHASARLDSIPGKILGLVPVVNSNLNAIDALAEDLDPVLSTGLDLKEAVDDLMKGEVVDDGRIDVDSVAALEDPLDKELRALKELETSIDDHRGGALLPNVWEAFTDLDERVDEFVADAEGLAGVMDNLDSLLGSDGKKTYLTMLLNNAEIRGAGGILTGIGTVTVKNGKMKLGKFQSVHDLATHPQKYVDVPPDFKRFIDFNANSTRFLNASASPDIPDSALVTARLYELVTGTETDGAIVIDPRGLEALLPPGQTLPAPKPVGEVKAEDMPRFVYSDAYEAFEDQTARRNAILAVGRAAFELIVERGFGGRERLEAAGEAMAGGHLRVLSFDEEEQAALAPVGITGDLRPLDEDTLLVTAQNYGGAPGNGSKMDFWAERTIGHTCRISSEKSASCVTSVRLSNDAPKGLDDYVTGGSKPYGMIRNFVEVYIPADAEITGVEKNDGPTKYFAPEQGDRVAVGVYLEEPPGESSTIEIGYDLPIDGSYKLEAIPQPLAKDARLEIAMRVPPEWVLRGPGADQDDDVLRYEGPFDDTLEFTAYPERRSGLPALWDSVVEFWNEPPF